MSWRSYWGVCLILLIAAVLTGCGGGAATPESAPPDTPVPAVEPTAAPTETPTEAPTEVPTEAPTEAPTEVPTETPVPEPEESVRFKWSPAGNLPSDEDDVKDIMGDLRRSYEGIKGGFGNEIGVTVRYNPEIMTLEEVIAAFAAIGHPVEVNQ